MPVIAFASLDAEQISANLTPRLKSAIYSSSSLLATNRPLFPCRLQLPIPLGMYFLLTSGEHVRRQPVLHSFSPAQTGITFGQIEGGNDIRVLTRPSSAL